MGKEFEKEIDMCICTVQSLCYTPETNRTLLINYAPIQNKTLKKKIILLYFKRYIKMVFKRIFLLNGSSQHCNPGLSDSRGQHLSIVPE